MYFAMKEENNLRSLKVHGICKLYFSLAVTVELEKTRPLLTSLIYVMITAHVPTLARVAVTGFHNKNLTIAAPITQRQLHLILSSGKKQ